MQLGPKLLKYVAKTLLQCLLALFVCMLQKTHLTKNAMAKNFSLAFAIWLCRPQLCITAFVYRMYFSVNDQKGEERKYSQWTHVRTYGTDVFALDVLSSISQASGDKLMKPRAYYCVLILVLRRLLPDF